MVLDSWCEPAIGHRLLSPMLSAHNGATDYKISASDGANIKQFIAAAAFPRIGAEGAR